MCLHVVALLQVVHPVVHAAICLLHSSEFEGMSLSSTNIFNRKLDRWSGTSCNSCGPGLVCQAASETCMRLIPRHTT